MSELKTLYQDKQIKLVTDGSTYEVGLVNPFVLVLPYTISENGYPDRIGLLEKDKMYDPIFIPVEDEDSDIFSAAKRGLEEISGFKMEDSDNWDFLGLVKSINFSNIGYASFSVNITSLTARNIEDNENLSKFNLVAVSQALDSDNAIIHSLFLKTFQFKIVNDNSK